jgi:hypothetical protein
MPAGNGRGSDKAQATRTELHNSGAEDPQSEDIQGSSSEIASPLTEAPESAN